MPNPSIASNLSTVVPSRRTTLALLTVVLAGAPWAAHAQAAPPSPSPAAAPIANLRPALANVQTAIGGLSIGRWKTSGDVRASAQQDAVSIQHDLTTTLPGLMAQAETNPAALSPTFAVFRNLDALYDVLLRVTETAALAGAGADATSLENARAGLENSRAQLGAWLLQAIGAQDEQVAHAAAPAARPAAAPAPPSRIVVDDGPANPKPRKKKPAAAPAPQ